MRIPFTKAHGARNDFLLTWANEAPTENLTAVARAICNRHSGIGADGWILVAPGGAESGHHASIRLFNADGSEAEISGNGTRCAAAFLFDAGLSAETVRILTGAGLKQLRVASRDGLRYLFEMDMGRPISKPEDLQFPLPLSAGPLEVSILDVGNPQCAVFVENFEFDWRKTGAEIERHPQFPKRTNVSFVRPLDRHSIEVRFFERGAGETMSSGTGSTGAAWAAALRGLVDSPIRILTEGGTLDARWDDSVYLTGPAEIVAGGEFYLD
jgi:diaminopimelate epimerase